MLSFRQTGPGSQHAADRYWQWFSRPTNLAFVWDREAGIKPLPTGANLYGAAFAINHADAISSYGDAPDGQTNAILWRKTGGKWQATYLGNLHTGIARLACRLTRPGRLSAVRGRMGVLPTLAFLWEDGGPMVDLNTLVPPASGLRLTEAQQINDRGEIATGALDAKGNSHAVVLIPCDEGHPGVEGCDYSMVDAETAAAAAQNPTRPHVASSMQLMPRSRRNGRYRMPRAQSQGR